MLKEPLVIQDFKDLRVHKEHLVFRDKQVTLKEPLVVQDFKVLKVPREHLAFKDKLAMHKV
tara:strand:- start:32 stop:214 length:183 start_codon:yes stop_codon:yes gene_type:complete